MYHAVACLTVPKLLYLGEHSEVSMIKNFRENGLNCKKLRFYSQEKNIRWSSS